MFEKVKNIVFSVGDENSITIEFRSFEDMIELLKANLEVLEKVMKIHFGEVRELTPEEFKEKYLKGRERKRKRGEDNE